MNRSGITVIVTLAALVGSAGADASERADQVILMIADGAGYNSWAATAMYQGTLGSEIQDGPEWTRIAVSTHPLRADAAPPVAAAHARSQLPAYVYDPRQAWDTRPTQGGSEEYPFHFAGYRWLRETAPDSASTMTTIVSGVKTYNGAVNVGGDGKPVNRTLAQLAHRSGRRVGVVSSVPFTHATPAAAAGVYAPDRRTSCALAVEMLTRPGIDVIAGCGNPDFDNNGRPIEAQDHRAVGGEAIWRSLRDGARLKAGTRVCAQEPYEEGFALTREQVAALRTWTLVQDRQRVEALAGGATPGRLLIVPQVGEVSFVPGRREGARPVRVGGTLQQQRGSRADPEYTDPGYDGPIDSVPSLAALTRAALNVLDDDPDGFFLAVEGGAVDWAMHENQLGRMVEEMIDFKQALAAVVAWVDRRDAWDRTLVVVTSDHDHMLWGPSSDSTPFEPLVNNGTGKLPSHRWLSDGHSNALVPLFARGAGATRLISLATGKDPFRGPYLDQTDVFRLLEAALDAPKSR